MNKFGRKYTLSVWPKMPFNPGSIGVQALTSEPELVISLPFTCEFDITRKTLASMNVAQFRIFNLSEENRNFLRFNASDYGFIQQIQFNAGYSDYPPLVFTGNISQAWSVREGVNFITQIECFDGGFASVNGQTNAYFPAGTPYQTVIASLAATLPNVSLGSIGNYPGVMPRGNTYSGNTVEILNQLTGGGFFIDNGKANCLNTSETISTPNPTQINASTGLLNTPLLEFNIARFEMLFEPTLHAGEVVEITSQTEYNFNGTYKITGVKHRGVISGAVCGTAYTTGEFFYVNNLTAVAQAVP